MSSFILRRLIQAIPTFLGITVISFVLMRLAPGDPITLMVGGAQDLTPENYAELRRAYGLDQPLPVQYADWLGHVLRGDLGQSFLYKRPVLQMIASAPKAPTEPSASLITWR